MKNRKFTDFELFLIESALTDYRVKVEASTEFKEHSIITKEYMLQSIDETVTKLK